MNEKTKQRLESEINVPAPTQPVDKLRFHEASAAVGSGPTPLYCAVCAWEGTATCFADDE